MLVLVIVCFLIIVGSLCGFSFLSPLLLLWQIKNQVNIMCGHVRAPGARESGRGRENTLCSRVYDGAPPRRGAPSPASCRAIRQHREDGVNQSPLILLEAPLIPLCIKTDTSKKVFQAPWGCILSQEGARATDVLQKLLLHKIEKAVAHRANPSRFWSTSKFHETPAREHISQDPIRSTRC